MFFLTFQVMAVGIHGSGSQRCLDYTSATHLDHLGGCREITPTALTLCQIFHAPFTLRLHGAVSKICNKNLPAWAPNHRRFPGSLMMARLIGHTNEGSKAHTISRFENPIPSLPAVVLSC